MTATVPYANLVNASILTNRYLLRRSGTLWAPPCTNGGTPTLVDAPRLMSGAGFGGGFAGIEPSGRPFALGMDLAAAGCATTLGQFGKVVGDPLGAAWIGVDGGLAVHRDGQHMRFHGAPGPDEAVLDVAMGLASGIVLRADGSTLFMHCRASGRPAVDDEPIRDLAARVPRAIAVAGNGACVAVVDPDGRPHFAGPMARGLASSVPDDLPPLASIALSDSARAAGLDADGRIHDWGVDAAGHAGLPADMQEARFVGLCLGRSWISAIDRDGIAHGFGPGMAPWAGVDMLGELLAIAIGS